MTKRGGQAERLGDFKALIRVYGGKGKAKRDAVGFVEANTWRARALDLSMQEREFTNAAMMANLIANTYHAKLKILSEAERSYLRAVQIATDPGMPSLAQQFREHAGREGMTCPGHETHPIAPAASPEPDWWFGASSATDVSR